MQHRRSVPLDPPWSPARGTGDLVARLPPEHRRQDRAEGRLPPSSWRDAGLEPSPEALLAQVYETAAATEPAWDDLAREMAAFFGVRSIGIIERGSDGADEIAVHACSDLPGRPRAVDSDSGRELLRLLLAAHDRMAGPGEFRWFASPRSEDDAGEIAKRLSALGLAGADSVSTRSALGRTTLLVLGHVDDDPRNPHLAGLAPLLVRHVAHALELARRMRATRFAALDRLDKAGIAAIVIDRAGRAKGVNQTAERLDADIPRLVDRFRPVDMSGAEIRLADLLRAPSSSRALSFDLIHRERRLTLSAVFARSDDPRGGDESAGMLLMVDAERLTEAACHAFATEYRLTKREAELTLALTRHGALKAAGNDLGISWETARRHLKQIFRKTHTHSQLDLLQLVLSESHLRQSTGCGESGGNVSKPTAIKK